MFNVNSIKNPTLTDLIDYVLQRALTVVESEQKDVLISKIRPQLVTMRRYSSAYSKHLISSMFSLYWVMWDILIYILQLNAFLKRLQASLWLIQLNPKTSGLRVNRLTLHNWIALQYNLLSSSSFYLASLLRINATYHCNHFFYLLYLYSYHFTTRTWLLNTCFQSYTLRFAVFTV